MKKKEVLLVVETSRAFGRGLLQGISQYILEHGDWTVHIEDRGLLEAAPGWLKKWNGDGIISRTASFSQAEMLRKLGKPTVELLGNGLNIVAEVRNDETQVASVVVEHFQQAGLTRIGFFAVGNAWWSQLRQEALISEAERLRMKVDCFLAAGQGNRVFYPPWEPWYDAAMLHWLKRLPKPSGIWSVSDALAIRLLEGCRRLGIAVPEEIAILGTTNDTLLCNVLTPPLSSVDLNSTRIGYVAAERLARKMSGKTVLSPLELIAPIGIVPRQSTDIVAFADAEIAEALRFIRENATQNISVDQVAAEIHVSRSTLQRRFRRLVGKTVEKEIMRVRMERAQRLLRETQFSLAGIALKTGFATVDYFVQAFRRENGLTPHQYRKRQMLVAEE